jgi:hypothetical protein
MDLQYMPAVLTEDKIEATDWMVSRIRANADRRGLNVFQRFACLRRLHEIEKVSFDRLVNAIDEDRLHQSDWSRYASVASSHELSKPRCHSALGFWKPYWENACHRLRSFVHPGIGSKSWINCTPRAWATASTIRTAGCRSAL